LSIDHIDLALESLLMLQEGKKIPRIEDGREVNLRGLVGLALKVKTRNN